MSESRLTYKPMLVVFTGLMAVTAMVLNGVTWSRTKVSIDELVEAQKVRDLWVSLLSTLTDAETGQRGFIITGDPAFLAPFMSANHRIGQDLAALKDSVRESPADLAEIEAIEVTVVSRFDSLKKVQVVRERESFEAARAIVATGEGKRLMDDLRAAVGSQIQRRQTVLLEKSARMTRDLRWGYICAVGAGLVALGSGMVAFLLLRDALKHARREQRLAEEKRRAESADREKSAFLATMSHEIRTPMNAILGFAELLRDRVTEERERKYIDSILAGGRSLLQLINDILDLSKIEAGMLQLNPEPTDLRATAQFVGQLFYQLAAERGIEFRTEIDDVIPRSLYFDHLRLRQILINVVGNAFKFTGQGHVTLRIRGEPEKGDLSRIHIIVEVEDTGRGIPADRLDSVFRPFVQVEGSGKAAGVPGTGLGLSIVQRLTRLMEGTVTVESEEGRGSLFRFDFPGVEVSSRLAESITGDEDEASDFNDFRTSTILVADDNAMNLELLSGIFEGTHHRILFAPDGESAVETVMRESPDLVLMDVRMPKKDGLEALAEIRGDARFRLLPVIAATASSLGSEDAQARRKFDGYLRKPFSRSQLYAQIAQFIPRAKEEGEGG
ncbi:MAG: CHASE3 domain-containing protein, partial [Verrucomicrobiales bacterium]